MQIVRSHTEENYLNDFIRVSVAIPLIIKPMNIKPNASPFHTTTAFSYAKILNTVSLAFKVCFKGHINDILKSTTVSIFPQGCSKKNYQLKKDHLWNLFTLAFLILFFSI